LLVRKALAREQRPEKAAVVGQMWKPRRKMVFHCERTRDSDELGAWRRAGVET
jgi:hypothetical protein